MTRNQSTVTVNHFSKEALIARHQARVDYGVIEDLAKRTGSYILAAPEMFGVTVLGANDLRQILRPKKGDNSQLIQEMNYFVHDSMPQIDEAPVDRIRILNFQGSSKRFVRVGLADDLVSMFEDERRKFYGHFSDPYNFVPKNTFPVALIPTCDDIVAERVRQELSNEFSGKHFALMGAEVTIS